MVLITHASLLDENCRGISPRDQDLIGNFDDEKVDCDEKITLEDLDVCVFFFFLSSVYSSLFSFYLAIKPGSVESVS